MIDIIILKALLSIHKADVACPDISEFSAQEQLCLYSKSIYSRYACWQN